jgi:hypothetical protein
MDLAAEAGCLVLEAIDRVADIIVNCHRDSWARGIGGKKHLTQ